MNKAALDYGRGATVTLKEANTEYTPVPDGIQAAYNEDTMLFLGQVCDPGIGGGNKRKPN